MHLRRVANPSSSVASGSWYLKHAYKHLELVSRILDTDLSSKLRAK